MRSFNKIVLLTIIITGSFLARDTVLIKGPLDMSPVFTILVTSFVSSIIIINITENRKTQNHDKIVLSIVSFSIGVFSLIGAYLFDFSNYGDYPLLRSLLINFESAAQSIMNYGYVTLILCIVFGLISGSNKKLGKTQSYKSSKHKYNY
ncbi:hypothetical protein [Proteocatella sphenisci]|uniref:hypothetical protein n=1 Tax=Proteocatella sphenisci TaxID=181070 RepID=UPI00048AF895|nr:hypothetical protein [Proteocatella sphenisci]